MSLLEQLEGHGERIAAAGRRVREIDLEARGAAEAVETAREELVEAHAVEAEPAEIGKLSRALTSAEDAARRLAEGKAAGARRALARAQADRQSFIGSRYAEIVAERRPAAERVATAVEDALAELVEAVAAWRAEESAMMAVMRDAGRGQDRTPDLPAGVVDIVRDVARLGPISVRAPLPI